MSMYTTSRVDRPTQEEVHHPRADNEMPHSGVADTHREQARCENVGGGVRRGPDNLARCIYDQIISQGHMALVGEVISPDFVDHVPHPFPGQPVKGPAAFIWVVSSFRTAFPDLRASIEDVIVSGDKVCVRSVWTGTHEGEFLGVVPTGRRVKVQAIEMARIAGGMIVEHWGEMDMLGLLKQLDLMPEPIGTPG